MGKIYVVKGINNKDWLRILTSFKKRIIIRDLDQDKDIKKHIDHWLYKGD